MWTALTCFASISAAQCSGEWRLPGRLGGETDVVFALTRFRGQIIASGRFSVAGVEPIRRIAFHDGTQWHELGGGAGTTAYQFPSVLLHDGDRLLVGGQFSELGSQSIGGLAWWDGVRWSADPDLGNLTVVNTATFLYDQLCLGGRIQLASGTYQFARRTASGWEGYFRTNEFSTNVMQSYHDAVYVITGGAFSLPFGRWWPDQQRFEAVTPFFPAFAAMTVFQDRLIAAGSPDVLTINGITTNIGAFDGQTWSALGQGLRDDAGRSATIYALSTDGERLFAAGSFSLPSGLVPAVAWWDGVAWHRLSTQGLPTSSTRVTRAYSDHLGTIVSGDFYRAGTGFAPGVALWQRCPADVAGPTSPNCDGAVTLDDLLAYIDFFAAGDPRADLDDGSGTGIPDAGVTIDDLLFFLNRFALGC